MTRPADSRRATRWALTLILLAAAIAAVLLLARGRNAPTGGAAGGGGAGGTASKENASLAHVEGLPAVDKPVALEPLDESPVPSVRLQVYEPAKARAALRSNPWLEQVAKEPLGVGFAGDWNAFLGTKGEDLQGAFAGTVLDLFLDKLLADPFELVWFGGKRGVSTPALVMRDTDSRVFKGAYETLERVAARGVYDVPTCVAPPPEESSATTAPSDAATPSASSSSSSAGTPAPAKQVKTPPLRIVRWTLAEHAVFVGRSNGRVVMAMHPTAVLQGLCSELAEVTRPTGTDLELLFAPEALGREYQGLAELLGGAKTPRLQFGIEGDRLEPRGLAASLAAPGRLDAGALSDDLLKLIPEQTGVVLAAQLKLPKSLDAESLRAHFAGAQPGGATPSPIPTKTRQVALLWQPRGDASAPTEVAILWSEPDDEAALRTLFDGPNHPRIEVVCGKPVVASGEVWLHRARETCAGSMPSMLHAAPSVVAGLRAKASIIFGVNLGLLGAQFVEEGWRTSPEAKSAPGEKGLPEVIENAQERLLQLPYVGLTGTVEKAALVPGGFRS